MIEKLIAMVKANRLSVAIAAVIVLVLLVLALAPKRANATGNTPAGPSASSSAVAGAVAGASAGAAATGGSATVGGVTTGPVNAGGSQSEVKTFGFGAPSSSNSINNCEVTLPFIGGSGIEEREACAVIRDSRAIYDMVPTDQERDAAVKARLCASEKIEKAFAVTKRPCVKVVQ